MTKKVGPPPGVPRTEEARQATLLGTLKKQLDNMVSPLLVRDPRFTYEDLLALRDIMKYKVEHHVDS